METKFVKITPSDNIKHKERVAEFPKDYWIGRNFYTLTYYNIYGSVLDSVDGIYIRDDGDLLEAIYEHFGRGYIKLVDTPEARYFNLDIAKTITTYV